MKRIACYVVALATLVFICNSVALAGIAQVTIIDQETGTVLTPHYYRGEYWIAGRPGARYAVEIHNRLGERVLAVGSVDGVNVISGETARWDQTGYVLGPRETYQIAGWRKSDTEVAAFTFTESPNSYAELTGRPANVGVIGVALFLERPTPPVREFGKIDAPVSEATVTGQAAGRGDRVTEPPITAVPPIAGLAETPSAAGRNPATPMPVPPPSSSAAPVPPLSRSAPSESDSVTARSAAPLPPRDVTQPEPVAPKLGTGHGEREYSFVTHTAFTRRQDSPNEVIRIRYDSFNNLVAMGIIPQPRPHIPAVDPFPGDPVAQHYVPDPPTALEDPR